MSKSKGENMGMIESGEINNISQIKNSEKEYSIKELSPFIRSVRLEMEKWFDKNRNIIPVDERKKLNNAFVSWSALENSWTPEKANFEGIKESALRAFERYFVEINNEGYKKELKDILTNAFDTCNLGK